MNGHVIFLSHNLQKRITYGAGLQGLGIIVAEAQNLDEVSDALVASQTPTTVVIDLQSPRMERDQVTDFLFTLRDRNVPFILIGKVDDREYADQIGAHLYLQACSVHDIHAVQENLQIIAESVK